jgi:hypothetical protein
MPVLARSDVLHKLSWLSRRVGAIGVVCLCLSGFAAVAVMTGCAPPTTEPYACPPGRPWVPDDYANGKWVPGHCLGMPAQ